MVNKSKCSILPISEKPVKFLGRTISDSLSDKNQADKLSISVNKGLVLAPIKGVTFILKLAKISGKLLLRESSNPFVASALVPVNAGNWLASSDPIAKQRQD